MKKIILMVALATAVMATGIYVPAGDGGGIYNDLDTGGATIFVPVGDGGFIANDV